jgi:hypothetical protein
VLNNLDTVFSFRVQNASVMVTIGRNVYADA